MDDREALKRRVCEAVDGHGQRIIGIGEAIMDAPELGFKEQKTAARVREVFEAAGLRCEAGLAITGVRAVLRGGRPGPTVALMGELDALVVPGHPRADPATGAAHACGHNAQIAGLAGAAMALAASGVAKHLAGNIVFFAVPAEEYVEIEYRHGLVKAGQTSFLCGKPELIERGHFDDVDMALMIHSSSPEMNGGTTGANASLNGFIAKSIRFVGRASHAGAAPEQGVNALAAAHVALAAIHAQRDLFRDEDCVRVHPIITRGGDLVNIVPADVRLETYVRGRTPDAIAAAADMVDRSLRGAALALGCRVEIETVPGDLPLVNDDALAAVYRRTATTLFGEDAYQQYPHAGGATDAGDLSQIMPVLHPMMTGASGEVHGTAWHIADHDAGYLMPARALAMMAIDLLGDDAAEARAVLAAHRPAMSKQAYLASQRAVFRAEVYDGMHAGDAA